MKKLLSDKFTLGGGCCCCWGPVGRNTSANTDVLMKAEILSWSRSRGVFAGISLEGATLRQDEDENAKLYGKPLTNEEILTGTVNRPATAGPFLAQLQRFSGKGVPPAVVPAKKRPADGPAERPDYGRRGPEHFSDSASDNTVNNGLIRRHRQRRRTSRGMARAHVQLTASIRRSIVADGSLSTYAHNIKIVVQNGVATLKVPARSEDEKAAIAAKAAAVVGPDHVVDQMEIAAQ